MNQIFDIIQYLEDADIFYTLHRFSDQSVMIVAAIPGERWEIDIFQDGTIEVERFVSDGTIFDRSTLMKWIATSKEYNSDNGA